MSQLLTNEGERITIIILNLLIIVFGVVGNASVIYVFGWKYRGKCSRYERLYLILAIADFFTCGVCPFLLIDRFGRSRLDTDTSLSTICKIVAVFASINIVLSQVVLLLICVERYRAIVLPLAPRIPSRIVMGSLIGAVIVGVASYLPLALSEGILCSEGMDPSNATKFKENSKTYLVTATVVVIKDVLAVSLMGFLILKIYKAILNSEINLRNKEIYSKAKNMAKARRMLIFMVFVFLLTSLPVTFYNLAVAIVHSRAVTEHELRQVNVYLRATPFLSSLQIANGIFNPMIYSRMHPTMIEFREDIGDILRRMARCYRQER